MEIRENSFAFLGILMLFLLALKSNGLTLLSQLILMKICYTEEERLI
jgi:hypothetical protein